MQLVKVSYGSTNNQLNISVGQTDCGRGRGTERGMNERMDVYKHLSPARKVLEKSAHNSIGVDTISQILDFRDEKMARNPMDLYLRVLKENSKSMFDSYIFQRIFRDCQNIKPGGYCQKFWAGVCGPLPKTLTLFMTKNLRFSLSYF